MPSPSWLRTAPVVEFRRGRTLLFSPAAPVAACPIVVLAGEIGAVSRTRFDRLAGWQRIDTAT
jgi:hypothetical protein